MCVCVCARVHEREVPLSHSTKISSGEQRIYKVSAPRAASQSAAGAQTLTVFFLPSPFLRLTVQDIFTPAGSVAHIPHTNFQIFPLLKLLYFR